AHGRDLGDFALERFVLEGFDFDARRLAEINLADIALVHFAFYVNLFGIAHGHDERGIRADLQDGTHGVADLNRAREDETIHRRGDGRVAQLLFELLEVRAVLRHLRIRLRNFGFAYDQLRARHV